MEQIWKVDEFVSKYWIMWLLTYFCQNMLVIYLFSFYTFNEWNFRIKEPELVQNIHALTMKMKLYITTIIITFYVLTSYYFLSIQII